MGWDALGRSLVLSLIAAAACDSPEAAANGASALDVNPAERWAQDTVPVARLPVSREVDHSRTTAIVSAAERVAPAVVSVNVLRTERVQARSIWDSFFLPPGTTRQRTGLGSGFIIDHGGTVLTNDHVVREANRIMVTLPDGRDFEAELVGTDEVTDVAVLRIGSDRLPVAPLGTSGGLMIGEWAVAIGNPFGYLLSNPEPTVTAGVISATGRHIVPSGQEDRGIYVGMIQTDASINPGNSGGPLVNALGQVIGINTSIFSRSGGSEGLGFAIPIDRALRIADDLVRFGEVRRAWLGMEVEAQEGDAWGRTRGVVVSRVAPGSAAEAAGIDAGDHLIQANGRALTNPMDFEAIMLDLRSGDDVEITVEGSRQPVQLTAGEPPSLTAERVTALQELELITVTPAIRAEQNLASEEGALIVSISDNLRSSLGLRAGDVILQVNNTVIRSADDAATALRPRGSRSVVMWLERNGQLMRRGFYWR
jgi:serine protease Do